MFYASKELHFLSVFSFLVKCYVNYYGCMYSFFYFFILEWGRCKEGKKESDASCWDKYVFDLGFRSLVFVKTKVN